MASSVKATRESSATPPPPKRKREEGEKSHRIRYVNGDLLSASEKYIAHQCNCICVSRKARGLAVSAAMQPPIRRMSVCCTRYGVAGACLCYLSSRYGCTPTVGTTIQEVSRSQCLQDSHARFRNGNNISVERYVHLPMSLHVQSRCDASC